MKSHYSGEIRYIYNGYDQVCNHLLEEYKRCATDMTIPGGKHLNNECCNTLYLIEKICIPGKRKMNI